MKFTVEYKSVEAIVVDAANNAEAINKAKEILADKFHRVESEWSAYEYDEESEDE